jgi:hypothetical protein
MTAFNEWVELFNQKPIKSSPLDAEHSTASSFADRMAVDYQQKQFDDLISKWNSKAHQFCCKVKEKFFNILTFPTGGWMIDMSEDEGLKDDKSIEENAMEDDDDDDTMNGSSCSKRDDAVRKSQLHALRKLYIPYICLILCEMLSKMGLNKELIRVGDIVASELYKLYDLFDLSQMKCFLNKIAAASVQLLEINKSDFLGY